ncbi:MAG: hypothetical protein QM534_14080 [Sediminibacterium sp.]|nr:hypothetical protein [Sediminibacterium sp.]
MALNSNQLEEISFQLPADWKIPFYEFVGGKLKLAEFEQKIYQSSELESIIGEDRYIDLVSFNFTDKHINEEVVKFILEKILIGETEYGCRLYVLIGKFYRTDIALKTKEAKTLPEAVVSIFEGAHIEVNYKGVDKFACDVAFLRNVKLLNRPVRDCRSVLPLSAVGIGYANDDDIHLFMDEEGIVYFYSGMIDQLNYGGKFLEALMILLLGLEYGKRLCPSWQR